MHIILRTNISHAHAVSLFVCLSLCSFCLSSFLGGLEFPKRSVCLPACLSVCVFVSLFFLFVCFPRRFGISEPVCLPACLSLCLCVCLSVLLLLLSERQCRVRWVRRRNRQTSGPRTFAPLYVSTFCLMQGVAPCWGDHFCWGDHHGGYHYGPLHWCQLYPRCTGDYCWGGSQRRRRHLLGEDRCRSLCGECWSLLQSPLGILLLVMLLCAQWLRKMPVAHSFVKLPPEKKRTS